MPRISELELVIPALHAMTIKGGSISTSDLITMLTDMLKPTGEDAETLAGRNDTKFSQKVRNLKAHNTLLDRRLANHINRGYKITEEGCQFVHDNRLQLNALLEFQFSDAAGKFSQIADGAPVEIIDEKFVTEGELRQRSQEYQTRSSKLRMAAIDHYSENGRIICNACDFEFAQAYPGLGDGYIQIHHLKPVSYLRGQALRIAEALENVKPLCANCHQMVHKRQPPMPIAELQTHIKVVYQYGL